MTFFSRFHKIIALTYGFLFLCTMVLFSFLYNEHKSSRLSTLQLRLLEETQALDFLLRVRSDAVRAMRVQAEDFLKSSHPFEWWEAIPLRDSPDKSYFHLDVPKENKYQVGNITGLGTKDRLGPKEWKEIAMSYSLNPLFKVLKLNIKTLISSQYISKKGFRNFYPWHPSVHDRFHKNVFHQSVYKNSLPHNNPHRDLFWTDWYKGFSTNELMFTCAAPVYLDDTFYGVVAIDFSLSAIDAYIESLPHPQGRFLVINNKGTVFGDTASTSKERKKAAYVAELLPSSLSLKTLMLSEAFKLLKQGNYYVFRAPTQQGPWSVVFYISAWELESSVWAQIGPSVLLILLFGALVMLGTHRLIIHDFIHPAHLLVKHIINQGEKKFAIDPEIREPWRGWLNTVSKVFQENRILVQELEKHIHELDDKVLERTKALSVKNLELEEALFKLQKAQNQIIVQEKLAGLGALAAGIAHEIKNPLNFIINFSTISADFFQELMTLMDQIQKEANISPAREQELKEISQTLISNMKKIAEHGHRADAIVRSMLLHAKGGIETLQKNNIQDLLEENLILELSGFHAKGFQLDIVRNYDPAIPLINSYKQDLGRVFLNLLQNAFDVMWKKQQEASTTDYVPKLSLTLKNLRKELKIIIRDNGPGIPRAIQRDIFNPFFTTKPAGEGTGLGLSLVYDIITQQHHGKVHVHSDEGKFSEFIIYLPRDL